MKSLINCILYLFRLKSHNRGQMSSNKTPSEEMLQTLTQLYSASPLPLQYKPLTHWSTSPGAHRPRCKKVSNRQISPDRWREESNTRNKIWAINGYRTPYRSGRWLAALLTLALLHFQYYCESIPINLGHSEVLHIDSNGGIFDAIVFSRTFVGKLAHSLWGIWAKKVGS